MVRAQLRAKEAELGEARLLLGRRASLLARGFKKKVVDFKNSRQRDRTDGLLGQQDK
jgi:hypothetical protein